MNKINLEITSKALSDVSLIADYIAEDNKKAANKLITILHKTFSDICAHPYIGRLREDFTYLDARFYVVKKHYLIIYRIINEETVRILRVLPAYQDICGLL